MAAAAMAGGGQHRAEEQKLKTRLTNQNQSGGFRMVPARYSYEEPQKSKGGNMIPLSHLYF